MLLTCYIKYSILYKSLNEMRQNEKNMLTEQNSYVNINKLSPRQAMTTKTKCSLKTEQCKMKLTPDVRCFTETLQRFEAQALKHKTSNFKSHQGSIKDKTFMESLILAQDERWRRA